MKLPHLLVAVLFLLFAYWQLNDPDSARWVAMYIAVALVAGWRAFAPLPRWLPWTVFGLAALWLVTLVPDFINWLKMGAPTITGQMKAESPHVELTREFLGLAICLITLGLYGRKAGKE